jgi:hypothetical protein
MGIQQSKGKATWWQWLIIPPIILLLLPVAVGMLLLFAISSVSLHICVWLLWCTRGRDILFVYSNSPVWHDYLEQRLLPWLEDRAVVLNWSDRSRWRFPPTLAVSRFIISVASANSTHWRWCSGRSDEHESLGSGSRSASSNTVILSLCTS